MCFGPRSCLHSHNLDESNFLVTPLSDSNKDEFLTPRDDIEILLHHDPSTPMESIVSILEGFIDEQPFKENDDLFDLECKTNDWKRILYDAPIDKAECFDPGGDNDEIDAFLAIKVPTYIEEGYYDSEGDVLYLESLLSDDNTHNISSESDPLHHEFAGGVITIPPRIVREREDYISRMSLLCGNSSSWSPKNFHTIIESLPTSTTLIEDSDSNREEIGIFSGPDDSIPAGIESDFDSKKDVIDNLLNDDLIPEYERLTFDMEPDVHMINNVNEDECFDPGGVRLMLKLTIPLHLSLGLFFRISLTLRFLAYFPPLRMRTPFLISASPLRAGGISSDGTFMCLNVYPNINESPIEIFSSIYTFSKDE
ncbi:hypothetical protein Tco_1109138 [Tanacetum coccineum]